VDLSGYDLLILVEIYQVRKCGVNKKYVPFAETMKSDGKQNVLGMSVVGADYEKLKRFNLEELHDPVENKDQKITEVTAGGDDGVDRVVGQDSTKQREPIEIKEDS
jgi:tRNA acetyltransferase TAN1